ncbi:MAG: hypothetical protein JXR31_02715 [Prolixibacteraceae bacterium]|nr:hypothetical protein [Prolixibacteraceae bacterium]MBN2773134.1 hypothetical protein [Prolixibacteraceae bacterium]
MKRFLIHIILFLIPLILGCIYLFIRPTDKQFAYHFVKGECSNKASWIYDRIFINNDPVDVVFLGDSHIANGLMDDYLQALFDSLFQNPVNVANIGYCRGGRDIQYTMLNDLFRHKSLKILILNVGEDEPKKGHPVFPYLATTSELFESFIYFNQKFFKFIWVGLTTRFEDLRLEILKGNVNYEFNSKLFGYQGSNQVMNITEQELNQKRWEKRLNRWKSKVIRNIELIYSKNYLKKIVRLADKNNCQVFFVYFPESGSKLKTPMLQEFYEDLAPLMFIPQEISSDPLNWKDPSHFNDSGAKKITEWLFKEISDKICN